MYITYPRLDQVLERREQAILRFALDFLKANLDDLSIEGSLEPFDTDYQDGILEQEIEKLKENLGVL